MATIIPWRESNRKGEMVYKSPYEGFTRADYALDYDRIPEVSKVEMVTRSFGHMLNNEVISKAKTAETRAKTEGTPFDLARFVHDERMKRIQAVLNGQLGVRESRAPVQEVDDVTREMRNMVLAKFCAFVVKRGRTVGKGPNDFPDEYNSTTEKMVIQGGKTLAEMVASAIESDPTWRVKAQKKVDEEKAARLAAAADTDDEDLEDLFADESEEEDAA